MKNNLFGCFFLIATLFIEILFLSILASSQGNPIVYLVMTVLVTIIVLILIKLKKSGIALLLALLFIMSLPFPVFLKHKEEMKLKHEEKYNQTETVDTHNTDIK
ncbi:MULTISPECIES: hypothetical protein [unclassified Lysinibacillus]|uniref:hypothetical protein n=1 Tax=unclassified Lysinibacillus TaxID=2636778 RepID=UPI0025551E24|nr:MULTISPECIES: hypothetical protein [unclassified Lysinibacillus]MDM5248150.1 hypothetical protein [Lysinibacillus sp. G4S2]